ncbi:MAG: DUF402 domain-containing protein [bacterium]
MGRWAVYVLTEDEYGLWLYSPKGTIYRGQTGSSITELEVGQGTGEAGFPVMHLIPSEAWWMAWWCSDGQTPFVSVDICTPPSLIDGEWTYIDLELDALGFSDGRVELHDEDEFTSACAAGLVSDDEATAARTALAEIERCLRQRIEPFGSVGWNRLAEAQRLSLSPITFLTDVPTT